MTLLLRLVVSNLAVWLLSLSAAHAETGLRLTHLGPAPAALAQPQPDLTTSARQQHGAPLPDGRPVYSGDGDIRAAWLSRPTDRYGHGVLGDAIEAGAVTVQRRDGSLVSFALPNNSVFEDLAPRLADLDGDGRTEVILVRSYLSRGAALSILGLRGDKLTLVAETAPIGVANRWLNPSLLLDDPVTGDIHVGLVRTPHIGGQLQIWTYQNGSLRLLASANGFSNHTIGSRALGLSAVLTKGKARRILLPDARQARLMLLDGEGLTTLTSVQLPARPIGDFVRKHDANGRQSIEIILADGQLYRLDDPDARWFD